jgi:hypothetical protein
MDRRDSKGRFLTGNTGGPGRPMGSRNRLSEAFLAAVDADWSQHGNAVLARVRIVASLVPALGPSKPITPA